MVVSEARGLTSGGRAPRPGSRQAGADRRAVESAANCPRNDDCQRAQAEALTRLAEHFDHLFGPPGAPPEEQGEGMKALMNLGEVIGLWLKGCRFTRKWFPRVGWWLLPIAVTLLTKGSSEAVDALVQAATTALLAQPGGGA